MANKMYNYDIKIDKSNKFHIILVKSHKENKHITSATFWIIDKVIIDIDYFNQYIKYYDNEEYYIDGGNLTYTLEDARHELIEDLFFKVNKHI